jgi:hypothetical protein
VKAVSGDVLFAPRAALHEEYLSFVRQAKIGWAVAAAILLMSVVRPYHPVIPVAVAWSVLLALPLIPCAFVDRRTFANVLWGLRSPKSLRITISAAILSAAALIGVLAMPGPSVANWGWWLSPLFAASMAVVSNVWIQTRGDQFGGMGYFASFFFVRQFFGSPRSGGFLALLLLGIPVFAGAWVRFTTGSLLGCFFVYLCSAELVWLAASLGLGHS